MARCRASEQFHLLRGPVNEAEGYTLFASHTVWASHEDFVAWTKSENFRAAHSNAGSTKAVYIGHPTIRGLFGRRRRLSPPAYPAPASRLALPPAAVVSTQTARSCA